MRKKVWIINHHANDMYFDKGGRHYCFAKYLKRFGYNPVIFCSNAIHGQGDYYFSNVKLWQEHYTDEIGIPFVFIKTRKYISNGKDRILSMIDFYFNMIKTAAEFSKEKGKPDVIIGSSVHPFAVLAAEKIAKKMKVPCICEIRDLWPESIIEYGGYSKYNPAILYLRWVERKSYICADSIIFTAEGEYDYIKERGWEKIVPENKVYYINNGVDLEWFNDSKEKYKIVDSDLDNPNIFKVVYVGSIRRVNNLSLLLETAKYINNEKIKILIWGKGNELEELRKKARDEHIDNVIFKGDIEKKYIPYIVSSADLNIAHNTPSPLFRFGISFNKIFDYMAAGRPILSDFPCKYNPTVQVGAGIEVSTAEPKDIANAINQFVEMEKSQYDNYCKKAIEGAKKYDFKNLTKKLEEILVSE